MVISLLLTLPLLFALAAYFSRSERAAGTVLMFGAFAHTVLCALLIFFDNPHSLSLGGRVMFAANPFGSVILLVTSVLFLFAALYINFWQEPDNAAHDGQRGMRMPLFAALLLIFLFTMTLTAFAQDFGMLWVAVEATTLSSAPLIIYRKGKGALEAMWKYLLICSLGIGLALFGTMLIAASVHDPETGITFAALKTVLASGCYNPVWFKAGFVLCFAGYALKMGIAPFHTWMPDAYSESASPVSALLSGALVNYALLAVSHLWNIVPDELAEFCGGYLKFFGFFSLAAAAFFIINQKDFKRMLAYSSVEHMGLAVLFLAYGLTDYLCAHVVIHSLMKMSLFLVAGNIVLSYKSRSIAQVNGLFDRLPVNGALWIFGMLMLCGTPPSPLFFTELALVREAGLIPGAAVLLLLVVIFCAMSQRMLKMTAPGHGISADTQIDKLAKVPATVMFFAALSGIAVVLVKLCGE